MRGIMLALLVPGCCGSFGPGRAVGTSLVLASLACDAGETLRFRRHGMSEMNPLLGPTPGPVRVVTYFVVVGAAVVAANWRLPAWATLVLDGAVLAVQADSLAADMAVGSSPCGLTDSWHPRPYLDWVP